MNAIWRVETIDASLTAVGDEPVVLARRRLGTGAGPRSGHLLGNRPSPSDCGAGDRRRLLSRSGSRESIKVSHSCKMYSIVDPLKP